jgi:hypothetical protein
MSREMCLSMPNTLHLLMFLQIDGVFLAELGFMGNGWFSLENILQFQFGKIVIYGCCFGLGICAF